MLLLDSNAFGACKRMTMELKKSINGLKVEKPIITHLKLCTK